MDPPLLTLSVAVIFGFCSVIVESQRNLNPPPPPPVFSPPPPSESPPPPFAPPPRRLLPPRHRPPPHGHRDSGTRLGAPPEKENLNLGKEIGLVFVGVAGVLQVCVVGFLVVSRRQISKHGNGD